LSEFSGAVAPEAAFVLDSGIAALLRSSEDAEGMSETIPVVVGAPSRGFNGRRNDEAPSTRAKRLRIESGEQEAPSHVVAEVHYGLGRVVVCICGFRGTGTSDQAMAEAFASHAG
jgi:hypothetical protein